MGLGATVKGLSIQAVSQHGILKRIETAAEDKKEAKVREGALLCLEGLTLSLGRLFDPYVVSSLPLLLQAFSDPQAGVREASKSASGAMMSQLSGPGVKQVLNPLLEGIKDKQWRTKLGSIELLSAMTNCLPKQLAACLPKVVPELCGVINDQHAKVKDAAREALDKVGSIITSPELRAIAPELIEALTEGAQYEHITRNVLDKLLGTSFVHHIDAPSLSLVCPLVQRALKERSAEMKRKGAQIVGSMVLLIKDAKDIQPYLPLLLPQLKVTLVDPIPDVRATAAKAFGTLAKELPEEMLGDVLPWLFNMLRSSESAVERSGAAHGLSEVLMAMGEQRIEMLLPDILANAGNRDAPPEVKEGYLGLFVYLPVAMGQGFEPYIEEVLQTLLRGVSDDTTSVRDTAFRAGQVIVKQFGASHTARLLPPMEEGVFDVDWKIRHASVQLMGQLIEQILRAHRIPTNSAELMQCEVLPKEWRQHMLASLYIVRSDENGVVKQACAQVWKAVVQNTPRTLKELLPALMTKLIAHLASTNREKQRVAARCVGDLVGKLGERVMPELMPIFMNTLSTGDAHVREGVCIGLAELINATTKQLLADYLADLIPAIRQAIIDDVETVRNSASSVVALLHNAVGPRATTDVVGWVLAQLQEADVEEHGHLFINGLEKLLARQPSAVLPIVLSRLTAPGEDGFTPMQLMGLSALAVVPDSHTVHRHLSDVLPVMIDVASDEDAEEDLREAAIDSATRVMERVEQDGLNLLFAELISAIKDESSAARRATGVRLFERFFDKTSLNVVPVLPTALPAVLPPALADEDPETLASGVKALNAIVKKVKKEELAAYLTEVREAILKLISDPETKRVDPTKLLPGLCHHNGLEPLYPIYQQGLMFGSAEARELAARGLGELVGHTSEEALKPYVVKITGPLIRIVGDRFPGTVKKAIVDTLKSLLIRGGATLKPFLPQLQTTYVRCLQDPSEAVRQKAAESLGTLVRLSARTEPLIKELTTGAATHADPAVRLAMCSALGEVLANVPQPTSEEAQEKVLEAVLPRALGGAESEPRDIEVSAWVLGIVARRHAAAEKAEELINEHVALALEDEEDGIRLGGAFALAGACWSQKPQTPAPSQEFLSCLQEITSNWLPKLLCDADSQVLGGAAVLFASVARLHAEAGLPWDLLVAHADRFISLVVPGQVSARTVLRAVRHLAAAAAATGTTLPALPKLAAAVAARGADPGCEVPEDAERAMAAIFLANRGAGGEAEAKATLDKLAGGLEGKAASILKDYASKRLRIIAQHYAETDFAWDF
uniref:TOG domain-containing protein n=1 Tax=Alexandrium monilatum TaxID=311494 RepID=A0A7S4VLQ0_9DINO